MAPHHLASPPRRCPSLPRPESIPQEAHFVALELARSKHGDERKSHELAAERERQDALERLSQGFDVALAQSKDEVARMAQAMAEAAAHHDTKLLVQERAHHEELLKHRAQLDEDKAAALDRLAAEYGGDLTASEVELQKTMRAMEEAARHHDEALLRQEAQHLAVVQTHKLELEEAHAEAIAAAADQRNDAMQSLCAEYDDKIAGTKAELRRTAEAMQSARFHHNNALLQTEQAHLEELRLHRAALQSEHNDAMVAQRQQHAEAVAEHAAAHAMQVENHVQSTQDALQQAELAAEEQRVAALNDLLHAFDAQLAESKEPADVAPPPSPAVRQSTRRLVAELALYAEQCATGDASGHWPRTLEMGAARLFYVSVLRHSREGDTKRQERKLFDFLRRAAATLKASMRQGIGYARDGSNDVRDQELVDSASQEAAALAQREQLDVETAIAVAKEAEQSLETALTDAKTNHMQEADAIEQADEARQQAAIAEQQQADADAEEAALTQAEAQETQSGKAAAARHSMTFPDALSEEQSWSATSAS